MQKFGFLFSLFILVIGCKSVSNTPNSNTGFSIAFGSCNKHDLENNLWDDILAEEPDVFIWGGDIVYADTDNPQKIQQYYDLQDAVPAYAELKRKVFITGTWDDHDYGINDGGVEFPAKKGSQQAFLNFLDVPENDPRREQKGVYSSQTLSKPNGSVKIINLDTRYFRTALTEDEREGRRYRPNTYGEGTILGDAQWDWLKNELENSEADFNLIVSSIQFLSDQHGWEKWGNHPHEIDKMKQLIKASKAKGVIILSGDRHISEFSKTKVDGLAFPLIDFTSSGLTNAYTGFKGEVNPYRTGEVVKVNSYGLLKIDIEASAVYMKIMGDNGKVLQQLKQVY